MVTMLKKLALAIDCLQQDCVTLAFLKANLAEGTSLHGRACCQRPQFAVVQQMGVDNLVITCQVPANHAQYRITGFLYNHVQR